MKKKAFSLKARLASFRSAWKGLSVFVRQEHNAWIHCAMAILAILAGVLLFSALFQSVDQNPSYSAVRG